MRFAGPVFSPIALFAIFCCCSNCQGADKDAGSAGATAPAAKPAATAATSKKPRTTTAEGMNNVVERLRRQRAAEAGGKVLANQVERDKCLTDLAETEIKLDKLVEGDQQLAKARSSRDAACQEHEKNIASLLDGAEGYVNAKASADSAQKAWKEAKDEAAKKDAAADYYDAASELSRSRYYADSSPDLDKSRKAASQAEAAYESALKQAGAKSPEMKELLARRDSLKAKIETLSAIK